MNNRVLLSVSLAPLLGASQSLQQAAAMAALSVLGLSLHRLCMTPLRHALHGLGLELASLLLAATLVTCLELSLRAWALEPYTALGIYPALIALQCVLFEHALGRDQGWRPAMLLLGALGALQILLGLCRELLASGGLQLAQLAPGALILLGLALALFNRVQRKPAPTRRQGSL
ncbi:NADH:quinone oxidoreductase [Pseudomonas sp. MAFF212428]|uniref:NADH:quinone oxidoreductase n=1 Tax=Pseudomonas brassicae TaxID=2708063 RepID=A0A6B3NXR6_9PSED|nr:Rnf-Nqr domain containing protein [Pseudomonas brassicae]NER62253.1 NADH:quinone oxidoreductase [Pseudomonas brassicae]NER65931.1 NADH:quinone oxidoreductase [Pseudomonas brassicae]